jgi:hypothetical protein
MRAGSAHRAISPYFYGLFRPRVSIADDTIQAGATALRGPRFQVLEIFPIAQDAKSAWVSSLIFLGNGIPDSSDLILYPAA